MKIVRGLSASSGRARHDRGQVPAHAALVRTVEEEVIPRLLAARRVQAPARPVTCQAELGPAHVAELVRLVLKGTPPQASAYVGSLQAAGIGSDVLLLDLLTLTARRLGEMWEEDLCDFTDVTMGLLRLHNMMRLICAAFDAEMQPAAEAPRALLVQAPGEKHGLGLAMVVHFFRGAGWDVQSEPVGTYDDLVGLVSQGWFGVVGISVSCSDRLNALAAGIAALRRQSRNPRVGVMVGGPPFMKHPQLAKMVGADSTASDGQRAAQQAHVLLTQLARNP